MDSLHGAIDLWSRDPGLDLPRKILIVDDSPTIRATLNLALKHEFSLIESKDGEDAWRHLLADRGIELVITDLDMPRLDGYGLLERVRKSDNPRIVNTPVIVVTGVEETAAKERAFTLGANDFISKNTDYIELRARVRAHQRLSQLIRELDESRHILRRRAYTDPLTGLTNRRAFFESAEKSLRLMKRHEEDFSVIMIDIDHFKHINDRYGHQAGDAVLQQTARVLGTIVRGEDILARIGGEEFALALPYTSGLAAGVMAERLRRAMKTADIAFEGEQIPVTISQGLVTRDPACDASLDQLMALADKRLYLAKQLGRDRVCSSERTDAVIDPRAGEIRCPKLSEALRLIEQGRGELVHPYLHGLLGSLIPLAEYANTVIEQPFDLDAIKSRVNALKRLTEEAED
jgi:diguanylate cyclase (GGDEF)-like protein